MIVIHPVSDSLFQQGWQLYTQRLDKDWGLTDCISTSASRYILKLWLERTLRRSLRDRPYI